MSTEIDSLLTPTVTSLTAIASIRCQRAITLSEPEAQPDDVPNGARTPHSLADKGIMTWH